MSRLVDAQIKIILTDTKTKEKTIAYQTFNELYSNGNIVRIPKLSVEFKPMEYKYYGD